MLLPVCPAREWGLGKSSQALTKSWRKKEKEEQQITSHQMATD